MHSKFEGCQRGGPRELGVWLGPTTLGARRWARARGGPSRHACVGGSRARKGEGSWLGGPWATSWAVQQVGGKGN